MWLVVVPHLGPASMQALFEDESTARSAALECPLSVRQQDDKNV